jgi:tryptophan-rich sensory protein
MTTAAPARRVANYALLALFIVLVLGVGTFIGINTAPGEWYASLNKPPFNPPNWIFAPVWFILYVLIAIAGWRVALRRPDSSAMTLWFAQMILNWLWSPTFFLLRQPWPAAVVVLAMLSAILAFIWRAWRVDRPAALMFVPYAAWVSFATALNVSVAILN